jgi:integrase
LRNPAVSAALLYYLRSSPFSAEQRIFPFSPDRFRRLLRRVADSLGVGHTPYVPHSLRHGGATCDFLRGDSIEQIMFRGRWKSMESARRYIQTGRAIMATVDVPVQLNHSGSVLAGSLAAVMAHLQRSVSAVPTRPRGRRVRFLL